MNQYQTLINAKDMLIDAVAESKDNQYTSTDLLITNAFRKYENCLKTFLATLKSACIKKFPNNQDLPKEPAMGIVRFAQRNKIIKSSAVIAQIIQFYNQRKSSYLTEIPNKEVYKQMDLLLQVVNEFIASPL